MERVSEAPPGRRELVAPTLAASRGNIAPLKRPGDVWPLLLSEQARPVRFALVGGLAGLMQLILLPFLIRLGLHPIAANVAGFLVGAQLNFCLSNWFVWHDRLSADPLWPQLRRRWAVFHGSIAGTFLLNQFVFVIARGAVPDLIAAAAGISVAAVVNFLIQDRLTFRTSL